MDAPILKRQWVKAKDKIQHRWNDLDEEDVRRIDGDRNVLIDRLKSTYDMSDKVAEMQVADFERTLQVG